MTHCLISRPRVAIVALALAGVSPGRAQQIPVDAGYTATPATAPAYEDTGGVELTDGDVGSAVWPGAAVTPPLVGWQNIDATVTFNFSAPVTIGRVVAWFGDSDGSAGVGLPESVRIITDAPFDQLFPVSNPPGTGTTVPIEMDGLNLTTTSITLQIARDTALDNPVCCNGTYEWTMLTEVRFYSPPDPSFPSLVAPAAVDLGTVFSDPPAVAAQFTIGNSDLVATNLTVDSVTFSGPGAAHFTPGAFPATLLPGQSGQVAFTFDSGGILGNYDAIVEIASNDPNSPRLVPISVAVRAPDLIPSTAYQQAVVADQPMLYWTFDEAGDADDAISMVNNLAANELDAEGGTTRVGSTTTAGGVSLGRAGAFDGGGFTRFTAANLAPTGEISNYAVELWFNARDLTGMYLSESFTEGGIANTSSLIYGFNAHFGANEFEIFSGDRSGTVVSPNVWHHVVVGHYDSGELDIYIDGELAAVTGDFNSPWAFGRMSVGGIVVGGSNGFSGEIDEYAIYDLTGLADTSARRAHVADISGHFSVGESFRITDIALEPDNMIRLTWNSSPGTTYALFWSADLTGFGTDISDNIAASPGATTTFLFENPTVTPEAPSGSPELFFRVARNE